MEKDPLKYVRPNILSLEPYSTARDEYAGGEIDVGLDANESPYDNGVNRYPDPHHKALKARVAELKGMRAEAIFIGGAGSDEAIDLTYRIFCTPGRDKAVVTSPTYGVYSVAARINDVELVDVPLRPDYSLPVDELLAVKDAKLIWICSPNNPTGNAFPAADILRVVGGFDGIVAVDEAYADFMEGESMLRHLADHPNMVVLQTFSKAWGMAGLRAGMAFASPEIATLYNRVKYPYNMNAPTQAEVMRRIDMGLQNHVEEIVKERKMLEIALSALPYVLKVWPSDANFLLVDMEEPDHVYDYLTRRGVIVRNRSRVRGCGPALRITVGTPAENRKLISLLREYK